MCVSCLLKGTSQVIREIKETPSRLTALRHCMALCSLILGQGCWCIPTNGKKTVANQRANIICIAPSRNSTRAWKTYHFSKRMIYQLSWIGILECWRGWWPSWSPSFFKKRVVCRTFPISAASVLNNWEITLIKTLKSLNWKVAQRSDR